MKIRRFGKIYMHKILIDRFCEFQKSTKKWKFLTFLASLTYYKAFNGIIFIILKYSRLLWARWCIFQKNPRQIFFDQNHCISPSHGSFLKNFNLWITYGSHICNMHILWLRILLQFFCSQNFSDSAHANFQISIFSKMREHYIFKTQKRFF